MQLGAKGAVALHLRWVRLDLANFRMLKRSVFRTNPIASASLSVAEPSKVNLRASTMNNREKLVSVGVGPSQTDTYQPS